MIEVCQEVAFFILFNTTFGTINVTNSTFYALFNVCNRFLGTPSTGTVLAGTTRFGNNTTRVQVFPG
jgi:hypothetical protein